MDRLNQSFPDPLEFKSDEDYLYAAKTASIFKKVIAELLQVFDQKEGEVTFLENKKKNGEDMKGFDIGGDDNVS